MKDSLILTFDLEEWFHLCLPDDDISSWPYREKRFKANVEDLLEILAARNIKATFLVLGWIAEEYPETISEIFKMGHDIGTHSYAHELIYKQSYDEFTEDLLKSKNILEEIIGNEVNIYRAPAFSINNQTIWAFEILAENGIKYDLSLFQGRHSLGGIAGIKIEEPFVIRTNSGDLIEYPISVSNLFNLSFATCGGGYFRLIPYTLIKRLLKDRDYKMTYFHPRDFDYDQPRISMPIIKYFKTYVGLKNARKKFITLLDNHNMIALSTCVKTMPKRDMRIINIDELSKNL